MEKFKSELNEYKGFLPTEELESITYHIQKNTGYGMILHDSKKHLFDGACFSLITTGGFCMMSIPVFIREDNDGDFSLNINRNLDL